MEKIIFLNPLNKVYGDFFAEDEISKYSKEEQALYEKRLKYHRDLKNVVDTAYDDGKIEGKIERNYELAKGMKAKGIDIAIITEITGLSETEIENL